MTLADLDLAQRLAAVPGIWRAGMRLTRVDTPYLIVSCWRYAAEPAFPDRLRNWAWLVDATPCGAWGHGASTFLSALDDDAPDLDDAATRGALLDVARQMWGDPGLFCRPGDGGWCVINSNLRIIARGPTEGAAIAAAILAAPAVTVTTTPPPAPSAPCSSRT